MIQVKYQIHLVQVLVLSMFIVNTYAQTKGMGKPVNGKAPTGTERRVALVVGNKDYQSIGSLKNPVNDANDMAKALEDLGFEVIKGTNVDFRGFMKSISDFKNKLSSSDIAFFYYSGHGASYNGQSYLLPTDADISCLEEIEYKGVSLTRILGEVGIKGVKNSFVILDACRNLPNIVMCDKSKRDLFTTKGLIRPNNNPSGSIVVYATKEGQTADDNPNSRNGLFTGSFLKYLTIPNLSIRSILDKTSIEVVKQSNNSQSPGRYEEIFGDFYFVVSDKDQPSPTNKPQESDKVLPKPVAKPEVLTSGEIFERAEQAFEKKNYVEAISYYEQAANVGNSEAMNALGYMYQTATGVTKNAKKAKSWYERSYSQSNQKAAYNLGYMYEFGVEITADISQAKLYYQKSCDWGDANGCERVKHLSKSEKPVVPSTQLTKYMDLPFAEMVYIPGGSFEMGDTRNEGFASEKPVHKVKLDGFYMGKYEVTQRQWESIMGSNPSYFKDCPDCPVETVSWNDVQFFLKKLNLKTGSKYRLPTESEWEYAAGGGANIRTRFGNSMDILEPSIANFDANAKYAKSYSRAGEYREKPIKVGSFHSNGLGLYDMSGNVWEWCNDLYGADYYESSSSTNPTGPYTGVDRVLRGGSWANFPQFSRVANRSSSSPDSRRDSIGFRVVSPQ
jgi:formylglycine-generating enzyme required for sulfatase activity